MAIKRIYVTRPGYFIAAAMLLPLLDIIVVALRFWARTKQREALRVDDWLMIPATLLVLGIGAMTTYGVAEEAIAYPTAIPPAFTGNPLELTTPQITLVYKIQWAFELMLPLALGCVKASFLFFYLRIFSVNRRSLANYLLGGLIVLVTLWSVAFFFAAMFQCGTNFWAIWGSAMDLVENCSETMQLVLAVCITGFITDIAIILAPIPLIWQLHLSLAKKISIAAVFLLGAVIIVASLLRLVMMARLVAAGFSPDEDGVLVVTEYFYWGIVECSIGILAACVPTCRFLFKGWSWTPLSDTAKSLFSSRRSRSGDVLPRDESSSLSGDTNRSRSSRQGFETKVSDSGVAVAVKGSPMEKMPHREVV